MEATLGTVTQVTQEFAAASPLNNRYNNYLVSILDYTIGSKRGIEGASFFCLFVILLLI